MDARQVLDLLSNHPDVASVELIGSRARGEALRFSDWDFGIKVHDFPPFAHEISTLVARLRPLARQWDRLSETKCYMLVVHGPIKVDLLFPDEPNEQSGPWRVTEESLEHIDAHLWDWVLWLASKQFRGSLELVSTELSKLFGHILQPMGVRQAPQTISDAINDYKRARGDFEMRFQISVNTELQDEVEPRVSEALESR